MKTDSSKEVDFGVWWTLNGDERQFPRWRVSWVVKTGELYAIQPGRPELHIELCYFDSRAEVENTLEGCAEPGSQIYHNLKALMARREHSET
jgi:hypothetical protein